MKIKSLNRDSENRVPIFLGIDPVLKNILKKMGESGNVLGVSRHLHLDNSKPNIMETKYSAFEDLHIWQEGMKLCDQIYSTLQNCRDYSLRDQMQRSAVSIPSNIAEGFEIGSNRGFIRYLFIAKASSGELRTQIYIAIKRGYIDPAKGKELIDLAQKTSAMIYNFIKEKRKWLRQATGLFLFQFFPLCIFSF